MKQALLVIDCIKGVMETGSCAAFLAENKHVIPNINQLIAKARECGMLIIHIRLAFTPDYANLPLHAPNANQIRHNNKFLFGTTDAEFISAINMAKNEPVLNKKYGNPFYQSGLKELLQQHDIESVILTGVATDNAILYGAEEAMTSGLYVIVVTDACGAPTTKAHEDALAIMKHRTVNELLTTKELSEKLV